MFCSIWARLSFELAIPTIFRPINGIVMSDNNPLEHPYTFWISKRKSVLKGKNYNDCMKDIGTVYTVQEFWKLYSFMKRPSKIDDSCDLMLVRSFSFSVVFWIFILLSSSNAAFVLFGKKQLIRTADDGLFVSDATTPIGTAFYCNNAVHAPYSDIGRTQSWRWLASNFLSVTKSVGSYFLFAIRGIRWITIITRFRS